jgi:hypothetical protein
MMEEILGMVNEYQRKAEEARRELSAYIDSIVISDDELLSSIFEVFEFTKSQNIPITFIDKLPEIINHLETQEQSSSILLNFHESITSISSIDIDSSVSAFTSLSKQLSCLPLTKGPLLEELKSALESKKAVLVKELSKRLDSEFQISKNSIRIQENFKKTQKSLKNLEEWESFEKNCHSRLFSFFEESSSSVFKAKPLLNQSELKLSKQKSSHFALKVKNFETFLVFFNLFFEISPSQKFWKKTAEDLVVIQAEHCSEDESLRSESLKQAKILQDLLESSSISLNLLKIIENSKEYRLQSSCKQKLSNQQSLLLNLQEKEVVENSFTITESCQAFFQLTSSFFDLPCKTESEKLLILKSAKQSLILFQVLRSSKTLYDSHALSLQLADTEYILEKIDFLSSFQRNSQKIPEHLFYLLDYSDLSAFYEIDLAKTRERLVEINQEELKNICKPLNFALFEENSKFQEQVLMRAISFVRENFILRYLPMRLSSGLIGSVIDTLIDVTVDQILQKDDIFLKDFQTIKHFFTLIFNIRDVFQGENPTKFCLKWDRLEALLGIIEGKLVDILSMFKQGRYEGLFNLRELRKLIEALFEDNDKRRAALSQIN